MISYSCIGNTEIDNLPKETTYNLVEEDLSDYSGTYIIGYINGNSVYSFNGINDKGNYTTYNSYNNGVITKFTPVAEYLIEPYNSGYSIKILGGSNDGKYISGTSGSNTIVFSDTPIMNTIKYRSEMDIISNNAYLRFNISSNIFRYYKVSSYSSQAAISLFKKNSGLDKVPTDEMDFEVSDSGTYLTNTNFKDNHKLVANAIYSDGNKEIINKDQYSYKIFDNDNNLINAENNFPKAGNYRVYVEYKSYPAKMINIDVKEYKQITNINLSLKVVDYTTNDKLIDNVNSNLSFDIHYVNGESYTSLKYNDLSTYYLSINLLDPNNKPFDINNNFNTLGTYKLSIGTKEISSNVISINVTAPIKELDEYTLFIYMCGSDLESRSGLATSDLSEIDSVKNQPDNINIVIEAGGASSWRTTYRNVVNKDKLSRFHSLIDNMF